MDTVKTRLVTQMNYPDLMAYNGINDCFRRVLKEEGIGAFYRGLAPRLFSVVPMIGIQFGVYEVSVNQKTRTTTYFIIHDDADCISPSSRFNSVYEKVHGSKGWHGTGTGTRAFKGAVEKDGG